MTYNSTIYSAFNTQYSPEIDAVQIRYVSLTQYPDLPIPASLIPTGRCGWLDCIAPRPDSSPLYHQARGSAWLWTLDTGGIWPWHEVALRTALSCKGSSNWYWWVWWLDLFWRRGTLSRRWRPCKRGNVSHGAQVKKQMNKQTTALTRLQKNTDLPPQATETFCHTLTTHIEEETWHLTAYTATKTYDKSYCNTVTHICWLH